MDFFMTNTAYSNNIKPMLFGIAFMVMVFFGLFTAGTFQGVRAWQYASSNSIIDSGSGLQPQWVFSPNLSISAFLFSFPFFGLSVSLVRYFPFFASTAPPLCYFALFSLLISAALYKSALFALTTTSIFGLGAFIKIGSVFNFLASRTLFCYFSLLKHGFFLLKKLCIELVIRPFLVASSFYYTTSLGGVK